MKTSELTGPALDWAVAKCEGADEIHFGDAEQFLLLHSDPIEPMYHFCDDWAQGGPIIEREEITIKHVIPAMKDSMWQAHPSMSAKGAGGRWGIGPTPLIAAMRCFVSSRLGDEVEIPEELI